MKIFIRNISYLLLIVSSITLSAQTVKVTPAGETNFELQKGSRHINFTHNGNTYFISKYTQDMLTTFQVRIFGPDGDLIHASNPKINPGVFNNTYSYHDIFPFGDKIYVSIEHLDKKAGKNSLVLRSVSEGGIVSKEEVEALNFPYEKMMNTGNNYVSVSPDGKTLAVAGEYPFEKDQPSKVKVTLYDQALKKIKEEVITLPGEDKRFSEIKVVAGNDGVVYLLKKVKEKAEGTSLNVYQWSSSAAGKLKDYIISAGEPGHVMTYATAINPENELIISGTYAKGKYPGDKIDGIFFFNNNNMTDGVMKSFLLDKPVDNLVAQKVLINGNTVFLASEQFKEERPANNTAGTGTSLTDMNYIMKDNYIFAMDTEGNKKFQTILAKDFAPRLHNQMHQTGYFIVNDKLTALYNDEARKYNAGASTGTLMPVLVQITNDGLMQSPVLLTTAVGVPNYYIVYPAYINQTKPNEISVFSGNREVFQNLIIQVD